MQQRENTKGSSRALWSTVLTLALAASMVPQTDAATITVDGSTCTLADAITSANNNAAEGGCSAGSGADTIDLQADVTVAGSLPAVTTEVIIAGNNHAIRGNSTSVVLGNVMGTLEIRNTTISGGKGDFGGGLLNYMGTMTLRNCTISGNNASTGGGGIPNASTAGQPATLTVIDSVISGNTTDGTGGGIFNYSIDDTATVNVINSTISGNSAGTGGGGVSNYGKATSSIVTVNITKSTISGNSAAESGGGIYNHPYVSGAVTNIIVSNSTLKNNTAGLYGGGVENYDTLGSANLTVTNCTISGNSAVKDGGGVDTYTNYGTTIVTMSTITGNTVENKGGGMSSNAPGDNTRFIVKNNLISGNKAVIEGAELNNYTGALVLGGYNLLGHAGLDDAASFGRIDLSLTDVSATSDSGNPFALNAILSPLAYNGGPTMTHALPSGSPALDLAPKSECSTAPFSLDERGSIRPYGAGCDAGAYEYKSNILLMIVPVLAADSQH